MKVTVELFQRLFILNLLDSLTQELTELRWEALALRVTNPAILIRLNHYHESTLPVTLTLANSHPAGGGRLAADCR